MPPPRPSSRALSLLAQFAAFALLLFAARFLARGHLAVQTDEMCHVGAIAVDVLAHGVRFPLPAYAPVEYNNGSLVSGMLDAGLFALLGRRVLVLKLLPLFVWAAGAVACLALLRRALDELGVRDGAARGAGIAALVIGLALAPFTVTLESMVTVGFGSPAEGTPMNLVLLALFASGWARRAAWRTLLLWALFGAVFYVNKGTLLVLPVLAVAQLLLAWRAPAQLAAAAAGFVLGEMLDVLRLIERGSLGWSGIADTAQRHAVNFPYAAFDSLLTLADFRPTLLAAWGLALLVGGALLWRVATRWWAAGAAPERAPLALGLIGGVAWLHLAMLSVMARGGIDAYAVYGYPTLVLSVAVAVAWLCHRAAARWGAARGRAAALATVAVLLVLYRPDALTWGGPVVAELWRDRDGAACSWHLAEGFEREGRVGMVGRDPAADAHVIARCRSLAGEDQVLDCIGGIARTMQVRRGDRVAGAPPAALTPAEQRAFAFYYGVHRDGDASSCDDFSDAALRADCAAAVRLECLAFADISARVYEARRVAPPRCPLPEPPLPGYWSAARTALLTSPGDMPAHGARKIGKMDGCRGVFEECY